MAATRYLLDEARARAARPDRPGKSDAALAELATDGDDPELGFLKRTYRADFRDAFREALAALEPRARNILRHRYLDGLEVGELAALYGLHRVNMSKTLTRIRDELHDGVRRAFMKKLGVDRAELDSILALIGSHLEVSLAGLLRSKADP
jgi:RNA polymerase sigma-70 factor (ECF subfamily)